MTSMSVLDTLLSVVTRYFFMCIVDFSCQTNNEIRDMDRTVDLLKQAIHDKEAPMKVAQTRLDERCRRINVELCNDPVMTG